MHITNTHRARKTRWMSRMEKSKGSISVLETAEESRAPRRTHAGPRCSARLLATRPSGRFAVGERGSRTRASLPRDRHGRAGASEPPQQAGCECKRSRHQGQSSQSGVGVTATRRRPAWPPAAGARPGNGVCRGWHCVPARHMWKSRPPAPANVTLFGNKFLAEIVELRWEQR